MFAIQTHHMANINSFAQAEAFWAKTAVWKNQHASYRPLDGLRKFHMRLIKLDDGGYDCVLYNSSIVRYYPDRVELGCYSSQSTRAFASCVEPTGCSPVSASGQMFWQVATPDGIRFYAEGRERLKLAARGSGLWELTNKPQEQVVWHHDRGLATQARKMVKTYANWFAVVKKLTGREPLHSSSSAFPEKPIIFEFVKHHDDAQKFQIFADMLGSPKAVTELLYLHTGARYSTPSTHDCLPKRMPV